MPSISIALELMWSRAELTHPIAWWIVEQIVIQLVYKTDKVDLNLLHTKTKNPAARNSSIWKQGNDNKLPGTEIVNSCNFQKKM